MAGRTSAVVTAQIVDRLLACDLDTIFSLHNGGDCRVLRRIARHHLLSDRACGRARCLNLHLAVAVDLVELGPILEVVCRLLGHVCLIFNHLVDPVTDAVRRVIHIEELVFPLNCIILVIFHILRLAASRRSRWKHSIWLLNSMVVRLIDFQDQGATRPIVVRIR